MNKFVMETNEDEAATVQVQVKGVNRINRNFCQREKASLVK